MTVLSKSQPEINAFPLSRLRPYEIAQTADFQYHNLKKNHSKFKYRTVLQNSFHTDLNLPTYLDRDINLMHPIKMPKAVTIDLFTCIS